MSKERYSYDEITFDIFDTIDEEYPTMRKICNTLNQQSQRIAELEEQLKNAIVLPKELKIGDTVFYVDEDGVLKGKVVSVIKELNLLETGFVDWFYCVYEEGLTFHHLIGDVGTKLFATKEEAQAKLKELQGENK